MSGNAAGAEHFVERFAGFARDRAGKDPSWLEQLRREAIDRFAEVGVPTTRWEEWRYTNASALATGGYELASAEHDEVARAKVEELCEPVFACGLFVFVDGHFDRALSSPSPMPSGVQVRSLAALQREAPGALEELLSTDLDLKAHPFAALNTAFVEDGAAIVAPPDSAAGTPIHVVFISTPAACPSVTHPRVVIRAEAGSETTILVDHVSIGEGARFTNSVLDVSVGPNARIDAVLLQREGDDVHHVSNLRARLERDARLRCHSVTLGGALVRNDLTALLADEGAECELRGLYLGSDDHVIDNHTLVDHAVPHCTSHELYKGILGDTSRGVFRGRVVVRPGAQKTNATQSNANLLLSDRAEVDSKPQLEIYADDVKCSHGSTIGQIDADALFYLRSRGIPMARARDLLTRGFAEEITSALPAAALGAMVSDLLLDRLYHRGETR